MPFHKLCPQDRGNLRMAVELCPSLDSRTFRAGLQERRDPVYSVPIRQGQSPVPEVTGLSHKIPGEHHAVVKGITG